MTSYDWMVYNFNKLIVSAHVFNVAMKILQNVHVSFPSYQYVVVNGIIMSRVQNIQQTSGRFYIYTSYNSLFSLLSLLII
jgi:hypothetical protein